ncbi:hypothetical protein F5Y13DRAFT_122618 [Hypoxylon sp. FL1857]|nr:hypothetical protein F5Y13DRAFT_122618 [Hypoxylon sp. FL1857]
MRHSELLLALTSLFALASSSREHPRSKVELEPQEPWQVTKLTTGSPSGRPGSSPYAHLFGNITNPSSIPAGPGVSFDPSSANCTVEWVWAEEEPYGRTVECDTAEVELSGPGSGSGSISKWTIEVLQANTSHPSPTEDMNVKFTLTTNLTVDGNEYYKVLEGTQHFSLWENMRGTCGGSGVCSWNLREENIPVLIQPTVVACQGTC